MKEEEGEEEGEEEENQEEEDQEEEEEALEEDNGEEEEEEEEEAEETLESTEREGAAWVRFSPLHLHPAAAVCLPMALSPRQFFQGSQQGLSASVVLVSELARPGPQRWLPLGSSQSSSRKV